jgi:hypothetical protein
MLIELNMARSNGALGGGVPENVSGVAYMTKQETTPGDIVVLATSVVWDVRIGKAAKGTEVAEVGQSTIEGFEGSATSERGRGEHILDVRWVEDGPAPERSREATQMVCAEHACDHRLVTAFGNAVLLGGIGHRGLVLDPMLREVVKEIPRHILTTIVATQTLDAFSGLGLDVKE